jgi:hypothetical protein
MDGSLDVVRLVLGVARLGEVDLFGWWHSRGFSEAGAYVLGGALPRTWTLSALEAAVLSAAARHRDLFQRRTALHLFSDELPAKRLALSWLRTQKVEPSGADLVATLRGWTRDSGPRELLAWAGARAPRGESIARARRLGVVPAPDLSDPGRLREITRYLAAAYADQGTNIELPYFDLAP